MVTYDKIEELIRNFKDYENKNGVIPLKVIEILRIGDIAIWLKESSNGQTGFFIVYEVARNSNNWLFWCPSENQIRFMERELTPLYNNMEVLRNIK